MVARCTRKHTTATRECRVVLIRLVGCQHGGNQHKAYLVGDYGEQAWAFEHARANRQMTTRGTMGDWSLQRDVAQSRVLRL